MDKNHLLITTVQADEFIAQLSQSVGHTVQSILKESGLLHPNDNSHDDVLLSRVEAAALLKISLSSLQARMRQKQVPYKKIQKRVLFSKTELLKSLDQYNVKK